jgi:thioesterase domain-containing protein
MSMSTDTPSGTSAGSPPAGAATVDDRAWARHAESMKRIRLNLLKQLLKHDVRDSVETIIEGTDSGPTICWIHSLLGAGSEVMDFADELGPRRRLVSVRPSSADRNASFAHSIEQMSEKYVNELVAAQPDGPLVLVGRSAGVVIALHTARLLIRRGRAVSLFVALDFAPYNTGRDVGPYNLRHNYEILRNWAVQIGGEFKKSSSFKSFAVKLSKEVGARLIKGRVPPPLLNQAQRSVLNANERDFVETCDAAMKRYVYQPGPDEQFPVLIFLSTKQPDASEYNVRKKWRKIRADSDLEFITVPGTTHKAVAEKPHVRMVTKAVHEKIDRLSKARAIDYPSAPG